MTRQPAILVDRDGTLASCFMRPDDQSKEGWASFNAALPLDAVVPAVLNILRVVRLLRPDIAILVTSGRAAGDYIGDRRRFFLMRQWLAKFDVPYDHLFMRGGGDQRRDSVVKLEILDRYILPHYEVLMAIDDRPQVVEAWESRGIPVIAVTDPNIQPYILTQGET